MMLSFRYKDRSSEMLAGPLIFQVEPVIDSSRKMQVAREI